MYESVKLSLLDLVQEESGAAAAEYAILVALVAVAIFSSTIIFDLKSVFNLIKNTVLGFI
jgi:Flp pilus assembly pilin Flp